MRMPWLALLVSGAALADGAFPTAQRVLAREGDPAHLYLGASFGLVFSEDAGATWRYVCEPFISGPQNVTLYSLQADLALLALSPAGLVRSGDGGCGWTRTAQPPGGAWIDVFSDPVDGTRALAVSRSAAESAIWLSRDGGRSFGVQLFGTAELLDSVESAATDPSTIYAANVADFTGPGPALFRSSDGGAHWTRLDVPVPPPAALRILAVSPVDKGTLWLRATHLTTEEDELFVSTDSGETFTSLLRQPQGFLGFARAADGTLFLADGGPGVLARAPGASSFARLPGPHLQCLASSGARLLGCADGVQEPYDLAASDDLGRTWKPLLVFAEIEGPASCPAVASACGADWTYQQKLFAAARVPSGCGCASGEDLFAVVLAGSFAASRAARKRKPAGSSAVRLRSPR